MRRKREKKPVLIVRLAHRLGWRPGRVMSGVLEWIEVLAVAGLLVFLVMSFVTVRMHVPTENVAHKVRRSSIFS